MHTKKIIAMVLVAAMAVSGIVISPAVTSDSIFGEETYSGKYGDQLGKTEGDYSAYFYNAMVNAYIYGDGENGNENGQYAGLARPVAEGGQIVLQPEELVYTDTFESYEEFCARRDKWIAEQGEIMAQSLSDAYDAFIQDYPEVYWLKDMELECSFEEKIVAEATTAEQTGSIVGTIELVPSEYAGQISLYIREFNDAVLSAVEQITSNYQITPNTKSEDIIRAVHDYVASNNAYNYDAKNNPKDEAYEYAYTPLSIFLPQTTQKRETVCEGYSKAFKILCDRFGLDTAILVGLSYNSAGGTEQHMWNAANILGKWYAVDVTWDDQETGIEYTYFLAGNSSKGFFDTYAKDHIADNQFSIVDNAKQFVIPQIADKGLFDEDESEATTSETPSVEPTTASGGDETTTSDKTQTTTSNKPQTTTGSGGKIINYNWVVKGIKNTYYTGKPIKHTITITCNGKVLKEGKDYSLAYKNNTKAGKASVIITPKGDYAGISPMTVYFNISKISLSKISVKKIKTQKYKKGKAIKPKISLTVNGRKLKKGTDYKITYKNNKKRGTAKMIITGIGNYTGKKTIKFKIK